MKNTFFLVAVATLGLVLIFNIVHNNGGTRSGLNHVSKMVGKFVAQKTSMKNTITIEESLKGMKSNRPAAIPADPSISKYKEVYYKPEFLTFNDSKTAVWLGGTCPEIWDKWLQIAEAHEAGIPPLEIPDDMWEQYTLFGRVKVIGFYFNQVSTPSYRVWPDIDKQMEGTKEQIVEASSYKGSTASLYNAMTYYQEYIEGKVGTVVGSERPWAELMVLKHGAKALTTLEYWPTEIQTKKFNMTWIHPIDMAKRWSSYAQSFDFVVSYSSIEHSGLGRYGDPLDPFGDLREMAKMHCLLKEDGVFFFAVPVGRDTIYWNAHRLYGAIRLPWMLRGFITRNMNMKHQLILFLTAITGAVILLNIVYNAGKNQDIDSKFNLMAKLLSQKSTQRKTITIEESLKAMKNNGMPMEPADPSIMKYKEVYFKPETLSFNDNKTAKWLGGTCPEIWNKWLQIAEAHEAGIPPLEIPDEMWQEYTLFGRIKVIGFYFNQVSTPESRVWPDVDKQLEGTKEQIIGASTYQGATEALYNAMTHYKQYIEGKVGVVVGSERPWAELMALKHGAKAMTTLEYWPTEIQTKKYNMTWVHPIDMAKKWNSYAESFDFVVSYSSIEHSGLGRYGDPLDPFGDLREMAKMHCLLKPGGIFFFAVPIGKDAIYWNAHRVYGAIRVPWMLRGFKLLGVFANPSDTKPSEGIPTDIIWGTDWTRQPVLILQKV